MTTYVYRNGELVEKDKAARNNGPYVISDELPPLIHPATGKIMDSKSRFRAETKARGLTEIGNETQKDRRFDNMHDVRYDVARALEK